MKRPVRLALVLGLLALALGRGAADDAPPPRDGAVSVLDFGAKGDGRTDDAPAIQAALDANPGRTIYLPDRRPAPAPDYYCGSTLRLKGAGQSLRGDADGWGERPTLKFPAGVTGIAIEHGTATAAAVTDLCLEGSEPWSGVDATEAVLPLGFGGKEGASDADGIRIRANFVRIERVCIWRFGRHAINVGSDGTDAAAFGDSFYIANVHLMNNRGCGLHIRGGDSNAGTTIQVRTTVNQLWGIYDRSFLGNLHVSPVAHGNHSSLWAAPAERPVMEATWAKAGDAASGGPYRGADAPNVGNQWLAPYAESDQPPSRYGHKDIVIGGTDGAGTVGRHFWISTNKDVVGAMSTPFLWMKGVDDYAQWFTMKAGRTEPRDVTISVVNPDNSPRWDEVRGANGRGWEFWQGEQGKGRRRLAFGTDGATTLGGALTMTPVRDSDAASGSIFVGGDHKGMPCFKDAKGKVFTFALTPANQGNEKDKD